MQRNSKTNLDGLDPFGSLVGRKRSPFPTYAWVRKIACARTDDTAAPTNKMKQTMLATERPTLDGDVLAVCGEEAMGNGGILVLFISVLRRKWVSRVRVELARCVSTSLGCPYIRGDFVY